MMSCDSVITSYSIHYTKLYDEVERSDVLFLDMTRGFEGFDALLDAATAVPLVVPGGRATQAA